MRLGWFRYWLVGLLLGESLQSYRQRALRRLCGSINVSVTRVLAEKEQEKLSELDEQDIRAIIDSIRIGSNVDTELAFLMRDKFIQWQKGKEDDS
jgi:hypothetical protein